MLTTRKCECKILGALGTILEIVLSLKLFQNKKIIKKSGYK